MLVIKTPSYGMTDTHSIFSLCRPL